MELSVNFRRMIFGAFLLLVGAPARAGFPSTETFLPAVGRVAGQGGAQFYTTVWATNLTAAPQTFTFRFLKAGQSNPSPASFEDALRPGETKVYENVVESKLGLTDALGAARITSSGEIFVSERIYNQAPGDDLGKTEGLFFAGVPKSFSISAGQSASIQGVDQGGADNFRYNFALIETAGGSPTVNVQVFDGSGAMLGQKAYPMQPYEQIQPGVADVVPGISTTNARITATVTGGTGSVLLAGAQVANESQDSSGFEMSFRDDILGSGGGTAGVTSLNGLTGALTIAHGANTTVNVSGSTITIDAVSGSGTGLTAVAHDNSLAGSGTVAVPLGVANGQVVRSLNGLHDAVTLDAGANITITPMGSTLTIAATGGGGGGLTLPYSGSTDSSGTSFAIHNTSSASGSYGILGSGPEGVEGTATLTNGVGVSGSGGVSGFGVYGTGGTGVVGQGPTGVSGIATSGGNGVGVVGTGAVLGGTGVLGQGETGVSGSSTLSTGTGVTGTSASGFGVYGSGGTGVYGLGSDFGIYGDAEKASKGTGVRGTGGSSGVGVTGIGGTGVLGEGSSSSFGVWGTGGTGVFGAGPTGVSGSATTSTGNGVVGTGGSTGYGVYGVGGTGVHGTGSNYGVFSEGNYGGTGAKFFVEPHPADPTKEIRYVCLEGRESGTYFRGTGHVVGGFATIEVPEDFRMVTSEKGLTVVAMPVGEPAVLVCMKKGLDRIVIKGSADVEFDYMVNGVRKAFEDHRPITANIDFVPPSPDDPRWTANLPPESVRRMKANGTLNPDGSINLETAHRLGWDEQASWKRGRERVGEGTAAAQ